MHPLPLPLLSVVCFVCAMLAVLAKKLTLTGGFTAFAVAMLMGTAWGWIGLALLAGFFLLAGIATRVGGKAGVDKAHQEKRDAWQVLANGGVAALCAIPSLINTHQIGLFFMMAAGALSAATADTLASELGTVWGKRFVNILTWKPDQKGLDGVISLEGTLAGVAGSFIIGLIACWNFPFVEVVMIVFAGLIGNLMDSVLGAALERKHRIGNNIVNFVNTLTGALLMGFFWWLLRLGYFDWFFDLN